MEERAQKALEKAVAEHDPEKMNEIIEAALEGGASPENVRRALFTGLENLRQNMLTDKVQLPHFLLSLDTVHEGLKKIAGKSEPSKGDTLVIGTVPGDPHDLGKNIIAKVYEAGGYEVHDLGRDVSIESFIASIGDVQPKILALSAMMSTTMAQMPEIIQRVRQKIPGIIVMVGGAPLDARLARGFGADGYAESVVTVLEETEAAVERVSAGEKW